MGMSPDLQRAYDSFTMLATHYGLSYAGLAISIEPPAVYAIGNVTERGHNFAKLLRAYADLIDEKENSGMVDQDQPTCGSVN